MALLLSWLHTHVMMQVMPELHKDGTTIVMVTHSRHDASYADRIINLFDGEVVNEVIE